MIEPRVGEMRHLLQLQAPQRTPDGSGGAVASWALQAEIWAAVRPSKAGEAVVADRVQPIVSHEVWMRVRGDVTADMRLLWGARILQIKGVLQIGTPSRWLRCLVEERLP